LNTEPTYCRLCESRCGLIAQTDGQQIRAFLPDKTDPVSGGFMCETPQHSIGAIQAAERITEPMKRVNGTLTPVDWKTANAEIGESLRSVRASGGPAAIGLYLGDEVQRSTRTLVRSLAFGVGTGTPHIFSEQCLGAGPRLWAAEQLIGHPAPLLSDLGRAHYVLLLSGEQRDLGWGPMAPGMAHEAWIEHSRNTKGTKVIVADPRVTPFAESMDQHLQIRPGTEPYLMLGMLAAIVRGGWYDAQFIKDYTKNFDRLEQAIEPWSIEVVAEICGIDAPALSGVALKFSRAAMAVVHPARQSFQNEAGALGAWAWMALHAVTANVLRPGGLYENRGAFDLFPLMAQVPTEKAPKTSVGQHPLMWLQAPATALCKEIESGPVRALVTVNGNPLGTLPGANTTRRALEKLDLLVCIGRTEDETAAKADWVLPAAHSWEQANLCLHDNVLLPFHGTIWSAPLVPPRNLARPEEAILADLYQSMRPGLRKSVWGRHLGLTAQIVARADLEQWEHRAFSWSDGLDLEQTADDQRRIRLGDTDRSTWRPSTKDGLLDLLPTAIHSMVSGASGPTNSGITLRTGQALDRAPDAGHRAKTARTLTARIHPDLGPKDGARFQIETDHGSCTATAEHDSNLRIDMIDIPFTAGSEALNLLDPNGHDQWTGSPIFDGIVARISDT
jgi:anaerobic selenocysteine-containing dehydrogenase/formylmethanofuran dehydrogenase subunit D